MPVSSFPRNGAVLLAADKPLVSIIIPTYNRRDLLRLALESCFGQTYEAIQVVVVDDGSTDGTIDYLRSLGPSHGDKLIWVVQANLGPSAARNRGLGMACGEFVKFLDSDDTLETDAIAHFVHALDSTGADLCIGARRYMSPEGRKWRLNFLPPAGAVDRPLQRFFDLEIRPQQGLWFFRKRLFDDGFCWDETLLAREDTDLLGRLLVGGATVVGAPRAVLNQRYHDGTRQTGRQFDPEVFRRIHESNCKLYDLMVEHGRLEEAGRSFARALCRTALRMWARDREAARKCYRLARRAYWWPELVLLESYPRSTRIAAYALWAVGGLRLCGPLMHVRDWMRRKAKWYRDRRGCPGAI